MDKSISQPIGPTASSTSTPPSFSPNPHLYLQPSSDLYAKFDQLMLLVSGRVVYYGEAAAALRYFQALGAWLVSRLVG